jgi:hypothetical protein
MQQQARNYESSHGTRHDVNQLKIEPDQQYALQSQQMGHYLLAQQQQQPLSKPMVQQQGNNSYFMM